MPEPMLRQPVAVEWSGIKETDAAGIRSLERRLRPLLGDALVEIAERGAAHAQHADVQCRAAKLPPWKPAHDGVTRLIADHRH
jgi:hypothetical protein